MVLKKPKLEEDGFPETCPQQQMQLTVPKRSDTDPSFSRHIDKRKEPVSSRMVDIVQKQAAAEPGVENFKVRASGAHALIKAKDEPFMDDAFTNALPIAAIDPVIPKTAKRDDSNLWIKMWIRVQWAGIELRCGLESNAYLCSSIGAEFHVKVNKSIRQWSIQLVGRNQRTCGQSTVSPSYQGLTRSTILPG